MSTINVNRMVDSQGGVLAPISSVMRNRIINGDMRIDQRNAGASVSVSTTEVYTVDRWASRLATGSGHTVQRSTTAPAGFTNSLLATIGTGASPAAGDRNNFVQKIEGFNVADLGFGTANAQTVTISFWVRSSVTGTFSGAIANSATNRSYPFTYVINAANTFEQKIITIAGDTSGTWLTDNGNGMFLWIDLGAGTTYQGTAGAWAAADYRAASGATKLVATTGATFYITGVQLEKGTQATSFEYRQYGTELALCQRYYWKATGVGAGYNIDGLYAAAGGNGLVISWPHPMTMRAAPTATADYNDLTNCTVSLGTTITGFRVILSATSSGRTGAQFTSTGFVSMSAEL